MNIFKCDEGSELMTVSLPNFPHITSKFFQHCSLSDFYLNISHQKKKDHNELEGSEMGLSL